MVIMQQPGADLDNKAFYAYIEHRTVETPV